MPRESNRAPHDHRKWNGMQCDTTQANSNQCNNPQIKARASKLSDLPPAARLATLSAEDRARIDDLYFTSGQFLGCIIAAALGPFVAENKFYSVLCKMWQRLETLHIDPRWYLGLHIPVWMREDPRLWPLGNMAPPWERGQKTHPFGLSFTVHEFLNMCAEVDRVVFSAAEARETFGRLYKGSTRFLTSMIDELDDKRVSLVEFLADHVPERMECSPILLIILGHAQGEHTSDFRVNADRFYISVTAPGGVDEDGNLVGPMTHLQAAVFVTGLEANEEALKVLDAQGELDHLTEPHYDCKVGCKKEDLVLRRRPCCNTFTSQCCFIRYLEVVGPICPGCGEDFVKLVRTQMRGR